MTYQIRRAQHKDSAGIIQSHRRSIRELCDKDYSPAQISAWSGRNFQESRWCKSIDNDFVWVISDSEQNIYGFGHLQLKQSLEAHIVGLYFVPEITGLGYGKGLMKIMLAECHKRNIQNITLLSTKTAKSFYEKEGFSTFGDISQIKMGDEFIECFSMKY